jgi:hypothetical protein
MASAVARTLYFCHVLAPGRYFSPTLLKHNPSMPTVAQVSHSRAVAGSVVDGQLRESGVPDLRNAPVMSVPCRKRNSTRPSA